MPVQAALRTGRSLASRPRALAAVRGWGFPASPGPCQSTVLLPTPEAPAPSRRGSLRLLGLASSPGRDGKSALLLVR